MPDTTIDSHQHFWRIDRGDYDWIQPDNTVLHRDYQPADLRPELDAAGIGRTITVQATPTDAETAYLFDLTRNVDWVAGVVAWVNMEANDFEERLTGLRQQPKFVGIRPQLELIEASDWILRPSVVASFRVLERLQVPFDFLVTPRHLPHVIALLDKVPSLPAVIDHIAKPPIARGGFDDWVEHMAVIAQSQAVYCKLSGMITEADHRNWRPADLRPYVDHAYGVFGPERVMFGSDWPVCRMAGSYAQVVDALKSNLPPMDTEQQAALFGGNAARFYRV